MVSLICKDPCVQVSLISEWEDFCTCSIVIIVYYIVLFGSCVTGLLWVTLPSYGNKRLTVHTQPCPHFCIERESEEHIGYT